MQRPPPSTCRERRTRRNSWNVFAHPHTHHMSPYAHIPEQTSPLTEPTSTRRTRDTIVLPFAPHFLARDAILKIFLVARARDSHPDCPLFALSFALFRQVFPAPVSRAPTHPRASEHGPLPSARHDVGCARVRAVRSTGLLLFFERRRRPRARHCTSGNARLLT